MASSAPLAKRRALGGGSRGLAALVAEARTKRAEILEEEEAACRVSTAAAATLTTTTLDVNAAVVVPPASTLPQAPTSTPAAIRPALFYGGSLPRPPLHRGVLPSTPASAPALVSNGGINGAQFGGGTMSINRKRKEKTLETKWGTFCPCYARFSCLILTPMGIGAHAQGVSVDFETRNDPQMMLLVAGNVIRKGI